MVYAKILCFLTSLHGPARGRRDESDEEIGEHAVVYTSCRVWWEITYPPAPERLSPLQTNALQKSPSILRILVASAQVLGATLYDDLVSAPSSPCPLPLVSLPALPLSSILPPLHSLPMSSTPFKLHGPWLHYPALSSSHAPNFSET